jgi:hypothetical protein
MSPRPERTDKIASVIRVSSGNFLEIRADEPLNCELHGMFTGAPGGNRASASFGS